MPGIVALCAGYVLSQFYRSFLAVLAPQLSEEIGVNAETLSIALGAWFVAFALMQFPVGTALDRIGPRRTGGGLLTVAAVGAGVFASATSGLQIVAAMALIGVGCSAVLMAAIFLIARNYAPALMATLGSAFIAVGSLGNIIGSKPLAMASVAWGWRGTMLGLAVVTLAVAVAVIALVRDPPRAEADGSASTKGNGYLQLLADRRLWPILPCVLTGYAVAAGIRGIWVGPYLRDVHGLAVGEIGQTTLWMAIALAAGSLAYGPMDRIFNSRKWVIFGGNLIVMAAVGTLALFGPSSVGLASLLLVVIGFFGTSYAVQMAHVRAFVPQHLTGRGVTLMNFFSIGGVGLMQVATGRLFGLAGGEAAGGEGYYWLFMLYAATLAVTLVIYLAAHDAPPRAAAVNS
jgi:MFS family permease